MTPNRFKLSLLIVIALSASIGCSRRLYAQTNDWLDPLPPFKIADNLYYVGSKGLASYLVTTPEGHILINSNLEKSVPMIRDSVEKLGFKFTDIKILLISQAHWDHNAGSATIKRLTGAKYLVMDADVPAVESGGTSDFQYGNDPTTHYPPTKVDHVLHDGEEVKLGGAVLVAHLTPGHTKGCTTWTMKVQEKGRTYNVVIVGGPNVNPGYKLVNNAAYPGIAADFERTFRVMKALRPDIFLGAHGAYFDLETKYAQQKRRGVEAFIDPEGYANYVANREKAFRDELARQTDDGRRTTDEGRPTTVGPRSSVLGHRSSVVGHRSASHQSSVYLRRSNDSQDPRHLSFLVHTWGGSFRQFHHARFKRAPARRSRG